MDSHGQTVYTLGKGGSTYQGNKLQKRNQQKTEQKDGDDQVKRQGKNSVQDKERSLSEIQNQESMTGQKGKRSTDSENSSNRKLGISGPQEIVLMAELNRTGVTLDEVLKRYGIEDMSQMTPEIYNKSIAALKQTKPKNRTPGAAA